MIPNRTHKSELSFCSKILIRQSGSDLSFRLWVKVGRGKQGRRKRQGSWHGIFLK